MGVIGSHVDLTSGWRGHQANRGREPLSEFVAVVATPGNWPSLMEALFLFHCFLMLGRVGSN